MAQCVNLKATFGDRYWYLWDEAYAAERPEHHTVEVPWLTIIPCKFGRIFPWGGQVLAASCDAGGVKRRELARLPGVRVVVGGAKDCAEVVVTFDVAGIDAVAEVMEPRRQRQYSVEERAARAAQLAKVRPPRKGVKSTVSRRLLGRRRRDRRAG